MNSKIFPSTNTDSIPSELRNHRQWIGFQYEKSAGSTIFNPICMRDNSIASLENSASWSKFDDAISHHTNNISNGVDGIGFVLTEWDDCCAIRIINGVDPASGKMSSFAHEIIETFASYTEVSPNGRDIHILIRVESKKGQLFSRPDLECFDMHGFIPFSGHLVAGKGQVMERQPELESFLQKYFNNEAIEIDLIQNVNEAIARQEMAASRMDDDIGETPEKANTTAKKTPGVAAVVKIKTINSDAVTSTIIEKELVVENQSITAALDYAARGWPVFPCSVDKKPLIKDWPNKSTIQPEQITTWWSMWPDASIGCPTGPNGNGCFVLDVDLPGGPATLARLEEEHGPLPSTLRQRTGSGGQQLFFAYPNGMDIRNSAGKLGPGLDVRGEGGYVILPPSSHPSGGTYVWTNNGAITADAPTWFLDLLARLTKPVPEPKPEPSGNTADTTSYGRKALKQECRELARPRQGGRNDTLNRAAFLIGQLVAGGEIDPDEAEASLMDAAIRAGLPEPEARKTMMSGLESGEKEPRSALEKEDPVEQDEQSARHEGVNALVPFDTYIPASIPPNVVPGILRTFSLAVAEAVQVPFELAICNALGAIAVASQRKFRVLVKDGYSEGLNIYALCPLPPGERKSATVEACKKPLADWQREARLEAIDAIRDAESERKTLEKAIEAKRQKAASANNPEARQNIINDIKEMERELPEVPVPTRLLADDFTPEALCALMEQHDQRIGLMEAEGGLFDTLGGKYSSGVPNIDAVLKAWSGESTHVDRRGREPILLDDPHLTLCISPQPEIVQGLVGKPGFRGRGLIGRFLFFMPQSCLGSRRIDSTPLPMEIIVAWRLTLYRILDLPWAVDEHGEKTAYQIRLEPGAYALWKKFAEAVEVELRPGGGFEHMTDWAGKFPGQVVRLAGLLHIATNPEPHRQDMTEETMKHALDLAAILAEHAKAAYSLMGTDAAQECARAILRWIVRGRLEHFTARDALRAVRGRFPTMEKVNSGLALLLERAFIFAEEVSNGGPGRKPSQPYTVNHLTWQVDQGVI